MKDVVSIVREHADSVFERDPKNQFTALHYAAWIGHSKMAEFLIKSGSDLYAEDMFGRWPVDLAYGSGNRALIGIIESDTYPENRDPSHDPFDASASNVTPLHPKPPKRNDSKEGG